MNKLGSFSATNEMPRRAAAQVVEAGAPRRSILSGFHAMTALLASVCSAFMIPRFRACTLVRDRQSHGQGGVS
jgi:hypothetical protein